LIWSPDSKWVAFPVSEGHRVTETYVYHRLGEEFTKLETESLRVDAKGDVRSEYVSPVRWVKPSLLLLEQFRHLSRRERRRRYLPVHSDFGREDRQISNHFKEENSIEGVGASMPTQPESSTMYRPSNSRSAITTHNEPVKAEYEKKHSR
jgi:hypothetical protein